MKKRTVGAIAIFLFLSATGVGIYAWLLSGTFEYDLSRNGGQDDDWSGLKKTVAQIILPLLCEHDTEYATSYNEDVFNSLELGTPPDEVISRLGPPLVMRDSPSGGTESHILWHYSQHGATSQNYFSRVLKFDADGRLIKKFKSFYVD